jgi:hypothetical protein
MADDTTLSAGTGDGDTYRSLEDANNKKWAAAAVAYATTVGTPDVLQFVTPSAGLPVAQQGTWTVTGAGGTFPVTGTFWQATQPVSIASAVPITDNSGSLTVDNGGTFAVQAAQSGTWTVTGTGGTFPVTDNSGSLTVDAPVGTPVYVRLSDGASAISTLPVSGTFWQATQPVSLAASVAVTDNSGSLTVDNGGTFAVQAAQSGTWSVRAQDGSGNALTSKSVGSERAISVAIVDGSGSQVTSFGGSGGTASNFGSAFPSAGTAIGAKDSAGTNMAALNLDASGYLKVNVAAGGAGDGTILDGVNSSIKASVLGYTNSNPLAVRLTDTGGDYVAAGAGTQYTEDAAAAANPVGSMLMGVRRDTLSASEVSADGDNIALKATSYGQLHVAMANSVAVTGTFWQATQPVSGTFWQATQPVSIAASVAVTDNSGSLTVDAPVGTPAFVRLSDGSSAITTLPVSLASGAAAIAKAEDVASADADVGVPAMAVRKATPANTSGTDGDYEMLQMSAGRLWVDASGKTLTVDGSGVTQPVSAASLPLPSGAATSAKQPALGTAGSASTDVITVQGIASGTAQPISGTVAVNTVTTVSTVTAVTAISSALPAGTALLGKISASNETDAIYSGSTALTPKFASIAVSSSGDNSIVSAVVGKRIRVLRWRIVANGAVNAKWRDGTSDITGLSYLITNASTGGGYCPVGHFQTTSNTALQLNLSAAVAVGGELTYCEV